MSDIQITQLPLEKFSSFWLLMLTLELSFTDNNNNNNNGGGAASKFPSYTLDLQSSIFITHACFIWVPAGSAS